jgi:hypothetical protein
VGERAADRSPIANLPVANPRCGVSKERNRGSNLRVGGNLMMGGQRADCDLAVGTPHAAQFIYLGDIDERFRLSQAQLHDRKQAVATGNQLGAIAMLLQERDRFVDTPGALVGKL